MELLGILKYGLNCIVGVKFLFVLIEKQKPGVHASHVKMENSQAEIVAPPCINHKFCFA